LNKFEAKNIHIASEYLKNKLNAFKKVEKNNIKSENVYIVEGKKESLFKRVINLIFKS
jgi:hypothetical protein